MKVRTTMKYGDTAIASCEWELDDKASKVNKSLAALSIEDHLREPLTFEHQVLSEDEKNVGLGQTEEADTETGQSCDGTVQGDRDGEHCGVEHWSEIEED